LNKSVAILGCGWLGLPLARSLLGAGYTVHGSTTSANKLNLLSEAGINPFHIQLEEQKVVGPIKAFLKNVDVLLINVPPGLRNGGSENYVLKMESLCKAMLVSGVRNVLFVSSTSVYGRGEGETTEDTAPAPLTESGRQVLEAELLFRSTPRFKSIIIRLGGLIGPNRHPVTRLAGKKGLKNGDDPINLIHLNDAIHVIRTVLEGQHWNQVFNAVYPAHPSKKNYYRKEAQKRQLKVPAYDPPTSETKGKWVISRLFLSFDYSFFSSILN